MNKAMLRPIFRTKEQEIKTIAGIVGDTISQQVSKTIEEKLKEKPGEKISKVVTEIREREKIEKEKGEKEKEKEAEKAEIDKILSEKQAEIERIKKEIEVLCPTCETGHLHSFGQGKGIESGITYKCSTDGCGKEFVMVDKAADYKCVGCGVPIKKPERENIKLDGCPFCGSSKAIKFDWGKLWKNYQIKSR